MLSRRAAHQQLVGWRRRCERERRCEYDHLHLRWLFKAQEGWADRFHDAIEEKKSDRQGG